MHNHIPQRDIYTRCATLLHVHSCWLNFHRDIQRCWAHALIHFIEETGNIVGQFQFLVVAAFDQSKQSTHFVRSLLFYCRWQRVANGNIPTHTIRMVQDRTENTFKNTHTRNRTLFRRAASKHCETFNFRFKHRFPILYSPTVSHKSVSGGGRLIEPKDVFLGTCTTTPQPMQITTHGPYTRALVFCIDRCSVCGTTSEGRLNLIQYL